jgi:UDP-glucose 4-epimerase
LRRSCRITSCSSLARDVAASRAGIEKHVEAHILDGEAAGHGGAGYIGSVVTRALLASGHEVEVLDDLSTGHRASVPDSAAFHQMSVHDVARVLTPEAGFEGVLHFAGRIEVAESVARPDVYWDVNVRGSLALLEAARAAHVQRMIFSSTGSMYRGEGDEKLAETARVEPRNPYAAGKLMVDLMLSAEAAAFGLGATSLR